jgi:peptidyl-prolyl cis-trans isomerase C
MNRRFWGSPALTMVVLGAAIFALDAASGARDRDRIDVPQRVEDAWLGAFRETYGRSPSADEVEGLWRSHLEDEVLHRAALELGLDRQDPIVRRRLVQKMRFVLEDRVDRRPVDTATLQAWFERSPDRFAAPVSLDVRQRFFDRSRRADAEATVRAWAEGREAPSGDAFVHPEAQDGVTPQRLSARFGAGFAEAVSGLSEGAVVVVESSFGVHAVQVLRRDEPMAPTFEAVRTAVEEDWRQTHRDALLREELQSLSGRYEIRRGTL